MAAKYTLYGRHIQVNICYWEWNMVVAGRVERVVAFIKVQYNGKFIGGNKSGRQTQVVAI